MAAQDLVMDTMEHHHYLGTQGGEGAQG
jgi:hypothetical protein